MTTTAVFSGSIEVCIDYSGTTFKGKESKLKLYHFENNVWVDSTTNLDTTNKIICASVTSLSLFAIFEPVNTGPVADAGTDQSVYVTDLVTLNGSGSSDVDGDSLTFSWAFTSIPGGSAATLNNPTSVNPTFTIDVLGTYVVSLTVNDGTVNSEPDIVTISAVTQVTTPIVIIQEALYAVNDFDPEVFKNPKNRKALTNKLNAVIDKLGNGEYQDALKKLQNDILKKTDGCALTGSPDKNDWIKDCNAQAVIYPLVLEAIGLLS